MQQHEESTHYGLLAEFESPDDLLAAAKATFAAGYRKIDAYSPMPIHGLGEAIGFPRTRLPWLVFRLWPARCDHGLLPVLLGLGHRLSAQYRRQAFAQRADVHPSDL